MPVIREFAEGFSCTEGRRPASGGPDPFYQWSYRFPSIRTSPPSWLPPAGRRWTWWSSGMAEPVVLNDLPLTPKDYTVDGQTVTMYGIYFDKEQATASGRAGPELEDLRLFCQGRLVGPGHAGDGAGGPARYVRPRGHRLLPGPGGEPVAAVWPPGCRTCAISSPSSP